MIKRVVVLENEESILSELSQPRADRSGRRAELDAMLEEIEETAGEMPLKEVGRRFALEVEREAIELMLQQTGWNRKRAAALLQISTTTLWRRLKEFGIETDGSRRPVSIPSVSR